MITLSDLKQAIKDSDKEAVRSVLDNLGEDILEAGLDVGLYASDIEENYQGQFKNDVAFAQEMADQLGELLPNHWPYNCIDWAFAAKELMYDYAESNGHYFRMT